MTYFKRDKKWHAQITKDYKKIHIGYFENAEEAAKAYDDKASELFGQFSVLNFVENKNEKEIDFEEIVSAIKRASSENPNTQEVQYHIYDIPMNADFSLRLDKLRQIFKGRIGNSTKIKLVETRLVRDKDEMMKVYADFMEQGYEGAMVRNMSGAYEYDSRSINLQKLKVFEDDEFEITGIEEGRGALKGHVGAFILAVDDDYRRRLFRAKMKGTGITKFLKECFEDSSLWQGKWMRVQYQGWTRKEALPRFPVAMGMREAE